jgi:hypothetical protein
MGKRRIQRRKDQEETEREEGKIRRRKDKERIRRKEK